jgi:type IV secretory pathway VirJ component
MFRLLVLCLVLGVPAVAEGAGPQKLDVQVRGKTLTVSVYRPAGRPLGTIVMGSGDVGWVGLAVSMAEDLSARGYLVAGINVRQYLSAFTTKASHLTVADVPRDYATIAAALDAQSWLVHPVIVSGVSEGAGLSALAAAEAANHQWIDGVITMGLPEVVDLAWRWTDFTSWITKKDSGEPSFQAHEIVGRIAPVPLTLIQSTKDEYVPEADYRQLLASAREPKQLVLIDASNHRFTDRLPELRAAYAVALLWVVRQRGAQGAP